jgi:hypothetical protein
MTEEGCRLTPGCRNGGGPTGGTIYDNDLSLGLYESTAPDPSPGANGLWLGFESTDCYLHPPFMASAAGHLDIDSDKRDDDCEYRLAKAFAPLLAFDGREQCPQGEPYWLAKHIDNLEPFHTGDMVKIGYLAAYYNDCGGGGHVGDSEFIQLTVAYNPYTHHWELINSFLSAHLCPNDSFSCQLPWNSLGNSQSWGQAFEWPSGRSFAFPRVWVSLNKHANYRTRNHCDAGSTMFGFDTCDQGRDVGRFIVWQSHNLGSNHARIVNCVESETALPLYGIECFWTGTKFKGWKMGVPGVTPYKTLLLSVVFQATQIDVNTWWHGSFGD